MKRLGLLLSAMLLLAFAATSLNAEGNETTAKVEANATQDTNATQADANETESNSTETNTSK